MFDPGAGRAGAGGAAPGGRAWNQFLIDAGLGTLASGSQPGSTGAGALAAGLQSAFGQEPGRAETAKAEAAARREAAAAMREERRSDYEQNLKYRQQILDQYNAELDRAQKAGNNAKIRELENKIAGLKGGQGGMTFGDLPDTAQLIEYYVSAMGVDHEKAYDMALRAKTDPNARAKLITDWVKIIRESSNGLGFSNDELKRQATEIVDSISGAARSAGSADDPMAIRDLIQGNGAEDNARGLPSGEQP